MDKEIGELTLSTLTTEDIIPIERSGANFHLNLYDAIEKYSLDSPHSIIPVSTSAWTLAQGLSGGLASVNNSVDFQHRQLISSTNVAHAGWLRQFLNMSGSGNWLPGKVNEIDCTKPWRIAIAGNFEAASSGYSYSLFIGGIASGSPPTSTATRSTKGWQIKITATGAGAGTITPIIHNGTSAVSGSATSASFLAGNLVGIDILWAPGDGMYVYVNGVLATSVTSSDGTLITGTITSSQNGWASVLEHTAGTTGAQYAFIRPITVFLEK